MRKTIPWSASAVAITVLIVLTIGGFLLFAHQPEKQSTIIANDKTITNTSQETEQPGLINNKPAVIDKKEVTAGLTEPKKPTHKRRAKLAKVVSVADSSVNVVSAADEQPVVQTGKKDGPSLGEMVVMTYDSRKKAAAKTADSAASVQASTEKPATNTAIKKQEAHPQTGFASFEKYLKDEAISPDNMTGIVSLSFIVNSEGMLSNFKVIKSISEAADQKAIALVKNGPGWLGNPNGEAKEITVKIKFRKAG